MKTIYFVLVFLTLNWSSGWGQEGSIVRGKIFLVDEQDNPYSQRDLAFEIDIKFARTEGGNTIYCPTPSAVDSSDWNFEYPVDASCENKKLMLIAEINTPAGWKELPPRSEVQLVEGTMQYLAPNVKIRRPKNPDNTARSENFESARATLATSPKKALFLLTEASTGTDYEFTALAANLLEENHRQPDVYFLLKDKDLKSLPVDDHARFQFAMRKANAARAGDLKVEAIQAYAEAQEIYPTSREPISIAYTVLAEVIGSDDPNKIVEELSNYPTLKDSIQSVYTSWTANGKPAAASIGEQVAIEFTQENIVAIAGPDLP